MTGDAIDWAEEKLDWQQVNQRALELYSEGDEQEEALSRSMNEQIRNFVDRRTGLSGADVGIFSPENIGKLWGGGTDQETGLGYSGLGYKVEFTIKTRLAELDDLKSDMSSGGETKKKGNTVVVKFPDGRENRYYQLVKLAEKRGVI